MGASPVTQRDALATDRGERFNVVLTNPPFGKKSSYKMVGEDDSVTTERESCERIDFKFTTSNKQFNFLQPSGCARSADQGAVGVRLPHQCTQDAQDPAADLCRSGGLRAVRSSWTMKAEA
ncbi:MAG TPA: hypothetical protein VFJ15_05635 [Oleiagrimonas sp.]|nr:hypothetical protein [Oleiagrimonas sp.]